MQKYAKNVLKFSGLDDIVNCTFQPKTRKWGQSGQADMEEEKDGEDPVAQFVKRSDAWTRKVREDLKEKVETGYEALLRRYVQSAKCRMVALFTRHILSSLKDVIHVRFVAINM